MSLVTRCPACTTTFKVVRDQLRISDGWVRCGRCSEVFDATLDLMDTESGEPVPPHSFVSPKPPPLEEAAPASMPTSEDLEDLEEGLAPHAATAASPAAPPFDARQSDLQRLGQPPAQAAPAAERAPPAMTWPAAGMLDLPAQAPPSPPPVVSPSSEPGSEDSAPAVPAWRRIQVPPPAAAPTPLEGVMADEPWPMRRASAPPDATPPASASAIDAAVDAQLQKALRRARVQALREERARRSEDTASGVGASAAPPAVREGARVEPPSSSASVLRRASTDSAASAVEAPVSADSLLDSTMYAADFLASQPSALPGAPAARRRRAWLWSLLALLAGVLLVAQVLRHQRDPWAASQPALRPAIEALCALSGCVLSAPRRIDAVRIDGSSFTPSRQGERYELMFTLRNASATPVAMPSIELSLLDGNERPVVRRVFHPADFGAPAQMAPRGEQMAQLHLALQVPPGQQAAAVMGYSMLAFYP